MQRIQIAGAWLAAWLVAVLAVPSGAAPNVNSCKLLTPAELEAALRQKVTQVGIDASAMYGGGPLQGVTKFNCSWWVGAPVLDDKATYVLLDVMSRPTPTPTEQAAASQARAGTAVETVKITGGDCRSYKARNGKTVLNCYAEARGLGVFLDVTAPGSLPIAQVKPLIDKAVSRLP